MTGPDHAEHSEAIPITVVLADDHPTLRMGLRVLLEQAEDIRVVGEAGDGQEALDRIAATQPSVAVVDCQLPTRSGPEIAGEARRRGWPTRIIALSAFRDERYVRGMIDAGAVGYLLKEEAPTTIAAAVRAAAGGGSWFSPAVAAWVRRDRRPAPSVADLSERELAVLRLVARGQSNKEIARHLGVTDRTVEFHIGNILRKLDLTSRVEAAVWSGQRLPPE
jgi:DNA-binding NarL/FixJ family response regulator